MANTYTQLHIQFVFSVQFRAALIDASWKESLHQYITGIIQNHKHKMLQINSMPDHIHILIGLNPQEAISSLIQVVKAESTKWINDNNLTKSKFAWQGGFGAFSYSKDQLPKVIEYIKKPDDHRSKILLQNIRVC